MLSAITGSSDCFFEFIGMKSVNAFAHHREYITGVPLGFITVGT